MIFPSSLIFPQVQQELLCPVPSVIRGRKEALEALQAPGALGCRGISNAYSYNHILCFLKRSTKWIL